VHVISPYNLHATLNARYFFSNRKLYNIVKFWVISGLSNMVLTVF